MTEARAQQWGLQQISTFKVMCNSFDVFVIMALI